MAKITVVEKLPEQTATPNGAAVEGREPARNEGACLELAGGGIQPGGRPSSGFPRA